MCYEQCGNFCVYAVPGNDREEDGRGVTSVHYTHADRFEARLHCWLSIGEPGIVAASTFACSNEETEQNNGISPVTIHLVFFTRARCCIDSWSTNDQSNVDRSQRTIHSRHILRRILFSDCVLSTQKRVCVVRRIVCIVYDWLETFERNILVKLLHVGECDHSWSGETLLVGEETCLDSDVTCTREEKVNLYTTVSAIAHVVFISS